MREGLDDPGDWVQHRENRLWLPVRFLVQVDEADAAATKDCVDKNARCPQWAADGDCPVCKHLPGLPHGHWGTTSPSSSSMGLRAADEP